MSCVGKRFFRTFRPPCAKEEWRAMSLSRWKALFPSRHHRARPVPGLCPEFCPPPPTVASTERKIADKIRDKVRERRKASDVLHWKALFPSRHHRAPFPDFVPNFVRRRIAAYPMRRRRNPCGRRVRWYGRRPSNVSSLSLSLSRPPRVHRTHWRRKKKTRILAGFRTGVRTRRPWWERGRGVPCWKALFSHFQQRYRSPPSSSPRAPRSPGLCPEFCPPPVVRIYYIFRTVQNFPLENVEKTEFTILPPQSATRSYSSSSEVERRPQK